MKAPIKDRIRAALRKRGGKGSYHEIMYEVFPLEEYPRAWRRSINGGPPGCAMAFGRALREMGARDNYERGNGRMISTGDEP